jgi:hypothetical protein
MDHMDSTAFFIARRLGEAQDALRGLARAASIPPSPFRDDWALNGEVYLFGTFLRQKPPREAAGL